MQDEPAMQTDAITSAIIGAAIDVHCTLGPGLLESGYQRCLALELANRGLSVQTEVAVSLIYLGTEVGCGYRLDLLVEDTVIVEVKSIARFEPIHEAQLIAYLKLARKQVGLLLNFNVKWLADQGLKRVVVKFEEDEAARRSRR
jgi:GxxExxY protein